LGVSELFVFFGVCRFFNPPFPNPVGLLFSLCPFGPHTTLFSPTVKTDAARTGPPCAGAAFPGPEPPFRPLRPVPLDTGFGEVTAVLSAPLRPPGRVCGTPPSAGGTWRAVPPTRYNRVSGVVNTPFLSCGAPVVYTLFPRPRLAHRVEGLGCSAQMRFSFRMWATLVFWRFFSPFGLPAPIRAGEVTRSLPPSPLLRRAPHPPIFHLLCAPRPPRLVPWAPGPAPLPLFRSFPWVVSPPGPPFPHVPACLRPSQALWPTTPFLQQAILGESLRCFAGARPGSLDHVRSLKSLVPPGPPPFLGLGSIVFACFAGFG